MIYLENTTQSQQVYIPRQIIQTATTREINVITSGDVINIVDEKLEPYYTSAETDTQIENAAAAESARCEETYAKISDIPDVSDFVTSADVKTQVEEYNYVNSADVKTQIEDYHYITRGDLPDVSEFITSGQAQEQINQSLSGYATEQWVEDKHYLTEHQSLSAYSTTEQVEGMIATESARCEETYAKISDIPDVSDFVSSAQVQTQIDNSISGIPTQFKTINNESIIGEGNIEIQGGGSYSAGTNIDITDNVISVTGITIPDVSNFVTSADVKTQVEEYDYVNSGEVKTQIEDYHYITSASLPDVSDFVTSADVETQITGKHYVTSGDVKTQIEGYNYITSADAKTQIDEAIGAESARCEETYAKISDIPDVSDFVTSAQVETQITDKHYVTSAETKTQIEDYHYITSASLPDVSDFVTSADVKTQVENYNYVNSADVKTQIEDYHYTTSGDLQTFSAATVSALNNKATKANVTANTNMQFPKWNSEGVVTGTTGNTVYAQNLSINGTQKTMLQTTNSSFENIYAPTTEGSQGQPLISNGSGAPVWASFKFWFGTETQYNAITTKDSSTIYFVKPD